MSRHPPGPRPPWSVADAVLAPLLMAGVAAGGLLLAPRTDPPPLPWALGSTALGGIVASSWCLYRAFRSGEPRRLGLRGGPPWGPPVALALVPVFWGLSTAWAAALEALGVPAPPQFVVEQISAAPDALWSRLALAYGLLLAPLVEELLFRGFLLPPLVARSGRLRGVVLSALLFGVMHLADPWTVPVLVVYGLVFGGLRLSTDSLLPPLVLHLGNNLLAAWINLR